MNGNLRQMLPFIGLLFTVIVLHPEDSFYFGRFSPRIGCELLSEVAESCPTLATPWTVAYQAPLSMEFSRQGYWSELPCPSPGDLPNPGIEPGSPALQLDSLPSEPSGKPSGLLSLRFHLGGGVGD